MTLLTVDYRSPDAAEALAESLRTTGFAVVVSHPITPEVIARVQREWLAWFAGEEKYRYLPAPGRQDGYHPLEVSETAVGAAAKDLKEYFHWYPWGARPEGPSRSAAQLHREATAVATTLLGWLDRVTPPEVSAQLSMPLALMLAGSRRTLLRILHYPPVLSPPPPGAMRAAAHEDINLLTVLPAADRPGLQVLDLSGAWHDVPCDPGSLVVNSGDMLSWATGGFYPSTTHRVVLPEGDEAARSRVSTPLFLHAADDVGIGDTTAFELLRDRLRAIRGIEIGAEDEPPDDLPRPTT
ncbi:MAG: isopenicillin N synthase family oxygenase [Acidobacteriota bacterium]|nr:isopenicillin N synthase family oxygenase [Acidobacteriota bacterium]